MAQTTDYHQDDHTYYVEPVAIQSTVGQVPKRRRMDAPNPKTTSPSKHLSGLSNLKLLLDLTRDFFSVAGIPLLCNVCKSWNAYWKLRFKYSSRNRSVHFEYNVPTVKQKMFQELNHSLFDVVASWAHATDADFMAWGPVTKFPSFPMSSNNSNNNDPNPCATNKITIFEVDSDDESNEITNDSHDQTSVDGFEEYKIIPFISWFLKTINQQVQNHCKFDDDYYIYVLAVGILFDIKLLKMKVIELMMDNNHNHFRSAVMQQKYSVCQNPYISKLGEFLAQCNIYGVYDRHLNTIGIPSFFGICCLGGDFDFYQHYIEHCCNHDDKQVSKSGLCLTNVLPMIMLYLRIDLLDEYVHCQFDGSSAHASIDQEIQSFIYLINAAKLQEHRHGLFRLDVPCDDHKCNIIDNEHYHPSNRISFLGEVFSSHFCIGVNNNLSRHARCIEDTVDREESIAIYTNFRKFFDRMYNSFVFFENNWQLNKYIDLKDDIEKQQKIHKKFQVLTRNIIGFGYFFARIGYGTPSKNIITAIRKARKAKKNNDNETHGNKLVLAESDLKYFDIIHPLSLDGIGELYTNMKQIASEASIAEQINQPEYDVHFQRFVTTHNNLPEQSPMTADQVGGPLILSRHLELNPLTVFEKTLYIDDDDVV